MGHAPLLNLDYCTKSVQTRLAKSGWTEGLVFCQYLILRKLIRHYVIILMSYITIRLLMIPARLILLMVICHLLKVQWCRTLELIH